jgi:hypothetical protein
MRFMDEKPGTFYQCSCRFAYCERKRCVVCLVGNERLLNLSSNECDRWLFNTSFKGNYSKEDFVRLIEEEET